MQEGTRDRRGHSHPPQSTTSRENRQIENRRMTVTDHSVTSRPVAMPIESVTHYSVFVRTIRRRLQQSGLSITPPAATPDELWERVEAAWSAVPQEHIQSLFELMPRRVAVVISNNGGYSSY
ncbi:HTH_Tnp_Tc3_2 domain-containing protein [Trichonephila clavipes]|nr:HTH_Tnp_Tc3_2 domain-containing protein [Trichonephila clavipes]